MIHDYIHEFSLFMVWTFRLSQEASPIIARAFVLTLIRNRFSLIFYISNSTVLRETGRIFNELISTFKDQVDII